MRIYFSAPLFCEAERAFNEKVATRLREAGFEVWLPQEISIVKSESEGEKKFIYELNVSALKNSDVVVAVLDGANVDSGVAFEVGYATALGKQVIGLKTDHRVFSKFEEVNLMLEFSMKSICKTVEELIDFLKVISSSRTQLTH
ncbi:MAG: nucleoside 2-deoxyribosyltransferase [Candidatus Jordarchaeales archaeon]